MAQKIIVLKTCDLPHAEEDVEATETLEFGFDGFTYQLDLCPEHSDDVQNQVQGLIANARRSGGGRKKTSPTASKPSGSGSTPEELAAIRDWARKKGYTVSDRGRISGEIREAFDKAQKK